jgi:hypothetical protein
MTAGGGLYVYFFVGQWHKGTCREVMNGSNVRQHRPWWERINRSCCFSHDFCMEYRLKLQHTCHGLRTTMYMLLCLQNRSALEIRIIITSSSAHRGTTRVFSVPIGILNHRWSRCNGPVRYRRGPFLPSLPLYRYIARSPTRLSLLPVWK